MVAGSTGEGTLSASAVSDGGKAVGLAVLISLLAVYLPVASLVLPVLLPLPLAYLTLRQGAAVGVIGALLTGVVTLVVAGPVNGVFCFLLAGVVGVGLGLILAREWSYAATLLATAAVVATSLVAWAVAVWVLTGLDSAKLARLVEDSLEAARRTYAAMGVNAATIDATVAQVREVFRVLPSLLPGIVGSLAVLLAAGSVALAAVVFPRTGRPLAPQLAFSRLRLPWVCAYGFVGGLAALVGARWFGDSEHLARMAGLNLLILFLTLYFLQGFSLVHWYAVTRELGVGARIVVYGGSLLAQAFLWLLSWAGLLDTWFDYRQRFALSAAPAPQAGADADDEDEQEDEW